MAKPSDIPQLVYDNLRAVHESHVWRQHGFKADRLPNAAIFSMMPDRHDLVWEERHQPDILAITLAHMFATVELP